MELVYTYLAFIFVFTVIAIAVIIRLVLRHRMRFSTSHALKNLKRELALRREPGQQRITDENTGLAQQLSVSEIESTINLITVMNSNTVALAKASRLAIYAFIGTISLGVASFSPNSPVIRIAIIAATLACALAFLLAGVRRIYRLGKSNMTLNARFTQWAEAHPDYCDAPSKRRGSRQSSKESESAQQSW
ncbi:hypothetical protein QN217_07670 [Bifidobacterium fermentum]